MIAPPAQRAILPVALLLSFLVPIVILPLVSVAYFAVHGGPSALLRALARPDAQFALRLSFLLAATTTAIDLVLGTAAAYVLAKYRFPLRRTLLVLINLPVALPTVVIGTALLLLWGPLGLLGQHLSPLGFQPMFSLPGLLLAHLLVTFPYMVGAVKPILDEIEVSYEEAAHTLGASRWQTFRLVTLPYLRSALYSGAILTFAHSLGDFGATVMVSGNLRLRTQTAPLFIFAQFEAGNLDAALGVAGALALLSFLLFLLFLQVTERPCEETP